MQPVLADGNSFSREQQTWYNPRLLSICALLALVGFCIVEVGCQDVATTWSTEARSPDGRWLASARTQQWSGPGTAYDATTVSLKQLGTSLSPTQVLVFSHQ